MKWLVFLILTLLFTVDSHAQRSPRPPLPPGDEVQEIVDKLSDRSHLKDVDLLTSIYEVDGSADVIKGGVLSVIFRKLGELKSTQPAKFQELKKVLGANRNNIEITWHYWNTVVQVLYFGEFSSMDLEFLKNAQVLRLHFEREQMPSLARLVSLRFENPAARTIVDRIFAVGATAADALEFNPFFFADKHLGTPMHWLLKTLALSSDNIERVSRLGEYWVTKLETIGRIDRKSEEMENTFKKEYEASLKVYAASRASDLRRGVVLSREDLLVLLKHEIDVFREMLKHTLPSDFYKRLSFQENLQILIEYDEFHKRLYTTGTSLQSILEAAAVKRTPLDSELVKTIIEKATFRNADEIVLMLTHLKARGIDTSEINVDHFYRNFSYHLLKQIDQEPMVLVRLWALAEKNPEIEHYLSEALPGGERYEKPHSRGSKMSLRKLLAPVFSCFGAFKGDD